MEILIKKGSLCDEKTDAYILAFNSHHNNPDKERYEVEQAGARGVEKFIDLRLRKQYFKELLSQGSVIFMDALGGNATKIICVVCRNSNKDYKLMKASIREGMLNIFVHAHRYNIKQMAMVPLCVNDGLDIKDFIEAFNNAKESYLGEHFVEQITIVVPRDNNRDQNYRILQEEFAK